MAGSSDCRAAELERRIVLSQYLTAIQCAGSMPPQETGLTVNSWYGKFHLEMHCGMRLISRCGIGRRCSRRVWAGTTGSARRARSGSLARLRRSAMAKMVGPEGADSPSPIGPLLIWQQPHPVLCGTRYRRVRTAERWNVIVKSFLNLRSLWLVRAFRSSQAKVCSRSAGYSCAGKSSAARDLNPTFELAYWARLKGPERGESVWNEARSETDDVISKLSPLPAKDGVYLAHETARRLTPNAITITSSIPPRWRVARRRGDRETCAARSIKR